MMDGRCKQRNRRAPARITQRWRGHLRLNRNPAAEWQRRLNSIRHPSICESLAELNPTALQEDFLTVGHHLAIPLKGDNNSARFVLSVGFLIPLGIRLGSCPWASLAPWRFIRTAGSGLKTHVGFFSRIFIRIPPRRWNRIIPVSPAAAM